MMTSRERVGMALNHQEADRVPLDLGGSVVSGMHVDEVYLLRQALQLDSPGTPVKVVEPFQMLGEIKPDLLNALGVDVVGVEGPGTVFGFKKEGWKPWTTFGGTPVLVPEGFNTQPEPGGDILLYPEGDRSCAASGRMPQGGLYFDNIERQPPRDETPMNFEDNLEEYGPISDDELAYIAAETERLYTQTDKALLGNFGGVDIGNSAQIAGPMLKHPRGIRSFEAWLEAVLSRPDYFHRVWDRQCELAIANLTKVHAAVGERLAVVMVAGMDFGMQTGPLLSPRIFRELYKPFYIRLNRWVHEHTAWKTFIHSCGSVRAFLPDFIEAGFDILNPVQCSAADMDPAQLKREFGAHFTFWGGGVDTQHTLPFGTPEDVRKEVRERLRTFGPGGGFVFNTTHNVQARIPVENVIALYETVREHGAYPLG